MKEIYFLLYSSPLVQSHVSVKFCFENVNHKVSNKLRTLPNWEAMKCVVRPFMSLMSTTANEKLSDFVIVLPSVRSQSSSD